MSAYTNINDRELVALITQGNELAFAELVFRHTDRFFALAYRTLGQRSDAEDVVQAAFLKFWQRPHLWNPEKSEFTTWFYRVVMNRCRDYQRSVSRQYLMESSLAKQSTMETVSEETLAEKHQREKWRQQCLESGIKALSRPQRDALNLVVYCEIAQKEAAQILGINVKALESLLHRAKKKLAKHIDVLNKSVDLLPVDQTE